MRSTRMFPVAQKLKEIKVAICVNVDKPLNILANGAI